MKSWPSKLLLIGSVAALAMAIPASSQDRESPESLLPPGFGDPDDLPPPQERVPDQPGPQAPAPPAPPSSSPSLAPAPPAPPPPSSAFDGLAEVPVADVEGLQPSGPLNYFTIPEGRTRPVERVGVLGPGNFGLGPDSFGNANGIYLAALMRRLDAPLPSRWTSILLRRALLSRIAAPRGIHPVDWVAQRASLLVNMGEADAARLLVQSVDSQLFTPLMVQAAAQTALATADPGALCPIVEPARKLSDDKAVWTLAEAMCAALAGEPSRADALVDQARRQGGSGIDLRLAEKIVGAGAQTRRSVTIDWEGVDSLTPWRLGLAGATGTEIPSPLIDKASPRIVGWFARAPMVPLERRLGAAWTAASLGIFSSASLVEIYSLLLDSTDPAESSGTIGARLRTAWTDADAGERLEALRGLWNEGEGEAQTYARLILTAGASARLRPAEETLASAPNLIASMLSAGLDRQAARWSGVIDQQGEANRAWALLAVASPSPSVDLSSGRIRNYIDADDSPDRRRSRALVAALAGLGRISSDEASGLAGSLGLRLASDGAWARAIDRSARLRQPATAALLAATGLQTADWSGVPPAHLFRILRALRMAGLEYEARMIAAEAMTRL